MSLCGTIKYMPHSIKLLWEEICHWFTIPRRSIAQWKGAVSWHQMLSTVWQKVASWCVPCMPQPHVCVFHIVSSPLGKCIKVKYQRQHFLYYSQKTVVFESDLLMLGIVKPRKWNKTWLQPHWHQHCTSVLDSFRQTCTYRRVHTDKWVRVLCSPLEMPFTVCIFVKSCSFCWFKCLISLKLGSFINPVNIFTDWVNASVSSAGLPMQQWQGVQCGKLLPQPSAVSLPLPHLPQEEEALPSRCHVLSWEPLQ